MWGWKRFLSGALVFAAGCGGGEEFNSCLGETEISCPCDNGTEGVIRCKDGQLTACECPEFVEGQCQSDIECDDGAFCNGRERCAPNDDDADVNGCVPAAFEPLCDDGIDCTTDSCDDSQNRCIHTPPDEDGDGFGDGACEGADGASLGDDCDDSDPNRYPGNFEICDDDDVDEDCDPNTFGLRDQDGDGAIDGQCCNGDNCGDDCNDQSIAQNPLQPEFCDDVDNDCDGEVDEEATEVPWYVDADGDGFGTDEFDIIESCIPIAERSLLPTDCNDSAIARHPAQLEICDLADNNCNGLADEGPHCGVPLGYPVLPGAGGILAPPVTGSGGAAGTGGANSGSGGSSSGGSTMGSGGTGSGGTGTGGMGTGGMGMGTGGMGGGTPLELSCATRETMGADTVSGALPSGLTRWSGTVHMTGNVTVSGQDHLIIDAGTNIIADPDTQLILSGGRIEVDGTEASPVRFCGKEDTAGYWSGIALNTANAESYLDWVLLADGGGNGVAGALIVNADVPIHHMRVENSGDVGAWANEWGFGSNDLTVTGSLGEALVLDREEALRDLPLGGTYTGNADDRIRFLDNTFSLTTRLRNLGLRYFFKNSTIVQSSSEITIDPGVIIEMESDTTFDVGWNGASPLLNINGSELDPVIFRGRIAGDGFWGGFLVRANVRAGSTISNLVVQDGGSTRPAVELFYAIPIDGLTLEGNATQSLRVDSSGFHESSQGISISDGTGRALVLDSNALSTLPADTTFANNAATYIDVEDGDLRISGTIPALSLPYYIDDYVQTLDSAEITIAAGVEIFFGDDGYFLAGWNGQPNTLHIAGTVEEPVVFDHILAHTGGMPGKWAYLWIARNTNLSSTIRHLHLKNAGSTGFGALRLAPDPAIPAENFTNLTFEDSAAYCVYNSGDTSVDYTLPINGNAFLSCDFGLVGP